MFQETIPSMVQSCESMLSNLNEIKSKWFQYTAERIKNGLDCVKKKLQWKWLLFSAAQIEHWKTIGFQKTAMKINTVIEIKILSSLVVVILPF